jgi:hypothetical protein
MTTYLTLSPTGAPGQSTVASLQTDVERLLDTLPVDKQSTAYDEYLWAMASQTEGGKRLALQAWLMRWIRPGK